MRTYKFYKNELGWFIDLKYFPFSVAYCAMVAGADDLLDQLSNNSNTIKLKVSIRKFKGHDDILIRTEKLGLTMGSIYTPQKITLKTKIFNGQNLLWLCPVTLFVFLHYPKKIYYKTIN